MGRLGTIRPVPRGSVSGGTVRVLHEWKVAVVLGWFSSTASLPWSWPAAWGPTGLANKVVLLGFQLEQTWWSAGWLSPTIWLECCVPEGSVGEPFWATCLEIAGRLVPTRAYPYFFLTVGFRWSAAKLCYMLPSWDTSYDPWWSQKQRWF
jgi:hypothetical protein